MSNFLISAVIPAYNNGKYIGRAIESVLSQSYMPYEVIVVDDGSTDNTREVVEAFGDKVRYIYKDNGGASSARNAGVIAAKGDWIAFLDGDDEWLAGRLSNQIELLREDDSLNWVGSNYLTCLCLSGRKAPYTPLARFEEVLGGCKSISYYDAVIKGVSGWTGTMLIKKQCLVEAGLFGVEQKKANDFDMWWRIACRWPQIGVVSEPAAIYHTQIAGSITKARFSSKLYSELILRHRQIATEFDKQSDFDRMAFFILRRWIRGMLFHRDRANEIRSLTANTKIILPFWFCLIVRLCIIWPTGTEFVLRTISRVSRALKLRGRLVPPPDKMNDE